MLTRWNSSQNTHMSTAGRAQSGKFVSIFHMLLVILRVRVYTKMHTIRTKILDTRKLTVSKSTLVYTEGLREWENDWHQVFWMQTLILRSKKICIKISSSSKKSTRSVVRRKLSFGWIKKNLTWRKSHILSHPHQNILTHDHNIFFQCNQGKTIVSAKTL